MSRAPHDLEQVVGTVEVERIEIPETIAQGGGEHALPGGGPDHGEAGQLEPQRLGAGALATDEVELEVLHRRVERFLHRTSEPVDLVDKEDVAIFEVGEDRSERSLVLDRRSGGRPDIDAHLICHDVRERRLAKSRRAGDQDVLDRLFTSPGGADEDL